MSDHISHILGSSEEEISQLLSQVFDVETLYLFTSKETDVENKQLFFNLLKVMGAILYLLSFGLTFFFLGFKESNITGNQACC